MSSNDKNLRIITQRLGCNQDMNAARREVFGAIEKVKGLTEDEQKIGAALIAGSASKLDVFFNPPDERRARLRSVFRLEATRLLGGHE
ncbi:uncharacterized protein A4U43_C04F28470 [Asparagus officinalis]|uniref:Uncharacterized protein n=1 Tax=Asparagus officinalis TaxID=4686 RepID=A0A5P1F513_ASPOF|nr:uncharacterized protein A4U43_C04F28470 [Asparagus officinalis]